MQPIHTHFDNLKINSQHRRIVMAAGLGIFLDGYDLSIIAVALLLLKPQWHLGAVQTGLLGAATLAGAALGGLIGGRIADRYGRKILYWWMLPLFFLPPSFPASPGMSAPSLYCASYWVLASVWITL